jgi:hypothetical protein
VKVVRDFTGNDIYFMEVLSDKVVVNDGYEGLLVLDSRLKTVCKHRVMNGLMIDVAFKKGSEVLVYCHENRIFVHMDVVMRSCKAIPLLPELYDTSFLAIYEWIGDEVALLADGGGVGVRVDVLTGKITTSEDITDSETFSLLRDGWGRLNEPLVHAVYPERRIALVESEEGIGCVRYDNGMRTAFDVERISLHDLEGYDDYVAQVGEFGIILSKGRESVCLEPEPQGYVFLRGKFLRTGGKTLFLTLASRDFGPPACRIQRLVLTPDLFLAAKEK